MNNNNKGKVFEKTLAKVVAFLEQSCASAESSCACRVPSSRPSWSVPGVHIGIRAVQLHTWLTTRAVRPPGKGLKQISPVSSILVDLKEN